MSGIRSATLEAFIDDMFTRKLTDKARSVLIKLLNYDRLYIEGTMQDWLDGGMECSWRDLRNSISLADSIEATIEFLITSDGFFEEY